MTTWNTWFSWTQFIILTCNTSNNFIHLSKFLNTKQFQKYLNFSTILPAGRFPSFLPFLLLFMASFAPWFHSEASISPTDLLPMNSSHSSRLIMISTSPLTYCKIGEGIKLGWQDISQAPKRWRVTATWQPLGFNWGVPCWKISAIGYLHLLIYNILYFITIYYTLQHFWPRIRDIHAYYISLSFSLSFYIYNKVATPNSISIPCDSHPHAHCYTYIYNIIFIYYINIKIIHYKSHLAISLIAIIP